MTREEVLSGLLRGMARRHGALRRAYNGNFVDPWEDNDYCDNANWANPCGPRLRVSGLCAEHLHEENRRLKELVMEQERTRALGGIPPETDQTWGNTAAPVEIHPDYQGRI